MTTFLLNIKSDQKIHMIKAVRQITGMGLKEAKDGVEAGFVVQTNDIEPFLWHLSAQVAHHNRERLTCVINNAPLSAASPALAFTTEIKLHSPQPAPVPLRFAEGLASIG